MAQTDTKPTLLCIPDISGFTRFMAEINFELSSKVVPSLLNQVIYSNEIELKVSEIEGDAVLFFRQDGLPGAQKLVEQCRYFYLEFYRKMNELQQNHENREGADQIPEILGLKIILHYGEIGVAPIDKRIKLMGKDVIAAHRLLKNDIPQDEYILFSEQLLKRYETNEIENHLDWGKLQQGHIESDHLGNINFSYIDLRPLLSDRD
jgi:hypothetical protein